MGDSHHLVYGTLRDFVTGEELSDTDDERFRQKLVRLLAEERGFARDDLRVRLRHQMECGDLRGYSLTDIAVVLDGLFVMVVKYGPGSLVSRERPALATARTLSEDQTVPVAVVTNGHDAEVLDTKTGKVTGTGLAAIPTRQELAAALPSFDLRPVDSRRRLAESRILMAFDGIDNSCDCKDDWCD